MAIPNNRALARPAKDEWGVYDPQQAGLAALFARLDRDQAVTAAAAAPPVRKEVSEANRLVVPARPAPRDAK
jgi:hypothetical protein